MADGYSYVVDLVDKISGPARTAAQSLDSLGLSLKADAHEMKGLEQTMLALRSTGTMTIEMEKKLTQAISAKQKAIDGTSTKMRALALKEKEAGDAAKKASADASSLGGVMKTLGPYAEIAAAGLAILGAALLAVVIGGAKIALDAALFKNRTTAALKSALGTSEAAKATFLEIRKISDEIGISEKKAQELGLSLLDAGVAQKDLGDAIKSIALLEKVRGEEAANKLKELIKKSAAAGTFKLEGESLVGTGLSQVDVMAALAKKLGKSTAEVEAQLKAGQITATDGIAAINDALKQKMGGDDQKGLTSFGDAIEKAYEIFTRLFEDVNVAPLFDALKEMGSWLDSSTVAGDALKWLITTIFDGMFEAAKEVLPWVKIAFLELVIVALRIYLAFKPIGKQLEALKTQIFGVEGGASTLEFVIKALVDGMLIGVEVLGYMIQGFLFLFSLTVTLFSAIGGAAVSAFTTIWGAFESLWAFLQKLFSVEGATQIASDLINGLVNGITGGAQRVIDALTGVGKGAIDGVKGILGIKSPSSVMAELGNYTTEGFAQGVNEGSGGTQGAMNAAVAPPGGGAGGGRSIQVTFAEGAIVIAAGGASAKEIAQEVVPAALATALEEFWMQLGGGAESPA